MLFPPRVSVTKVWVVGGGEDGGLTLHLVCRLVKMVLVMILVMVALMMVTVLSFILSENLLPGNAYGNAYAIAMHCIVSLSSREILFFYRVDADPAVQGLWSRQDGLAGWSVEQSQVKVSQLKMS